MIGGHHRDSPLSLVPGLHLRVSGPSALYAYAKLPIATSEGDAQLPPRVDLMLGIGNRSVA